LDGKGIIKYKVLLIGTFIMQFFRTKAIPNWYFHCFVRVPTRLTKTTVYILKRTMCSMNIGGGWSLWSRRNGLWFGGHVRILWIFCNVLCQRY
jgi:hypothetical protein